MLKGKAMGIGVPIIVDSLKHGENEFEEHVMARSQFFSIELADPQPDWVLGLADSELPVIMVEMSAVICSPLNGRLFNSAKRINELFDYVESLRYLYIDTDGVWLPQYMFDKPPKRGEVYRMPGDLFARALLYTLNRLPEEKAFRKKKLIRYSESEHIAFIDWRDEQVRESIDKHKRDHKYASKRIEKSE